MKKLKITFIVPDIDISGGVKAVLEFSNHLIDLGHDLTVVYPTVPLSEGASWYNPGLLLRRGRTIAKRINKDSPVDWFNYRGKLIRTPTLAERYIPDGDVIFATWWETANNVAAYGKEKGEKFYLIQHHEVWGGQKDRVEATYRLGLQNIVNSRWLKDIIEKDLGSPVRALILHAPDLEQFFTEEVSRAEKVLKPEEASGPEEGIRPEEALRLDGLRVLMPYRDIEWKGVADGFAAFKIAKKKHPDIQLVLFGPDPNSDPRMPAGTEYHLSPYGDKLRKIYNSCDIFVFPSHLEGFGMPPLEAMACSCAVATTDVGAVQDYTVPGVTALVSPPKSPELLAENLILLIEDEPLRKNITKAGHDYIIKNFNWANAALQLEEVIKSHLAKRS